MNTDTSESTHSCRLDGLISTTYTAQLLNFGRPTIMWYHAWTSQ